MCGELGRSNVSDQCTALGSYSNKFHEKDGLRRARWVSRPELSVMLPGTLSFHGSEDAIQSIQTSSEHYSRN